jgi:phage-related protein
MKWHIEIFDEAVAEEIDAWPVELRASLLKIIERIEAVGLERMHEPHVKHMRSKIWEMRPSAGGNAGRALYVTAAGARLVIVVAFRKKTQKTPDHWIRLAEERAREVLK